MSSRKSKHTVEKTVRMLEKQNQKKVVAYAAKLGIVSIRMYFGPGSQIGWPDVLFLIPGGAPVFIEFKAPGKQPSPKQFIKIELLRSLRYMVFVCDDYVEGCNLIDTCCLAAAEAAAQA